MLGDKIREYRLQRGYTQEELAQKVGYKSKTTINKIELNINDIPLSKVEAFAKALGVAPSDLMGWREETADIEPLISELLGKLENDDVLLLGGKPVGKETRELMLQSIRIVQETAAKLTK